MGNRKSSYEGLSTGIPTVVSLGCSVWALVGCSLLGCSLVGCSLGTEPAGAAEIRGSHADGSGLPLLPDGESVDEWVQAEVDPESCQAAFRFELTSHGSAEEVGRPEEDDAVVGEPVPFRAEARFVGRVEGAPPSPSLELARLGASDEWEPLNADADNPDAEQSGGPLIARHRGELLEPGTYRLVLHGRSATTNGENDALHDEESSGEAEWCGDLALELRSCRGNACQERTVRCHLTRLPEAFAPGLAGSTDCGQWSDEIAGIEATAESHPLLEAATLNRRDQLGCEGNQAVLWNNIYTSHREDGALLPADLRVRVSIPQRASEDSTLEWQSSKLGAGEPMTFVTDENGKLVAMRPSPNESFVCASSRDDG